MLKKQCYKRFDKHRNSHFAQTSSLMSLDTGCNKLCTGRCRFSVSDI